MRERANSRLSEIQLTFARLFGVFDPTSPDPDKLRGGFSLHALDEFGQSFPVPDISQYLPHAVIEAGQLWSLDRNAALALRCGSMILLGLLRAEAFLIYPLISPIDISKLYREFRRVGPPFELNFAETVKGDSVWLQAMILDGKALREQVTSALSRGFEVGVGMSSIKFELLQADHSTEVTHLRSRMAG